jgi:DNA-binding SARP family transcriptional activator
VLVVIVCSIAREKSAIEGSSTAVAIMCSGGAILLVAISMSWRSSVSDHTAVGPIGARNRCREAIGLLALTGLASTSCLTNGGQRTESRLSSPPQAHIFRPRQDPGGPQVTERLRTATRCAAHANLLYHEPHLHAVPCPMLHAAFRTPATTTPGTTEIASRDIGQWFERKNLPPLAIGGATVDSLALAFVSLGVLAIREARGRRRNRRTRDAKPSAWDRNGCQELNDVTNAVECTSVELLIKLVGLLSEYQGGLEPGAARMARIGSEELEIRLSTPMPRLPPWISKSSSPQCVKAQSAIVAMLEPPRGDASPLVVLPIGHNEHGTWAVILQPGSSLAVLGPGAHDLFAVLATMVTKYPWSSQVRLDQDQSDWRLSWLADHLGSNALAKITHSPSEPADTTVLVDHRGLTVHPDGLVLTRIRGVSPAPPTEPLPAVTPGTERLSPGDLEIRLLTVVPRLDGLQVQLPANRARRTIELIAYLAIHHPDPISSDRLRTRVLGSPDADAAAKTLFNIVATARKALGHTPDGEPYLPNGSRHGRYVLSERVTVDALRAGNLFLTAKSAESQDLALALYRSGFDLIEGEPLAGSLSGYGWWRSEGHEARLSSVTVAAAANAVQLSIEQGLLDLAWWILDKARLVEAFSEMLSRAAMTIAAAAGDQARLRKEWDDCCRRVVELDPGASPSAETTILFRRLSHQ